MEFFSLTIPGPGGEPVRIEAPPGIPSGPQFTIGSLATLALQVAMIFGIIVSLGYLIYGGFYWIQASGSKDWDKSRRIIIYSILGLVIMSLSLVIVNVIASAFGVKTVVSP
jgi:hypothetical protein